MDQKHKLKQLKFIFFIAAALILFACNKDKNAPVIKESQPNPIDSRANPKPSQFGRRVLKFVDESHLNQGLAHFKQNLFHAIAKDEEQKILNAFSDRIRLDTVHPLGKEGVKAVWKLDGSKEKLLPLKSLLTQLLSDGGCLLNELEMDSTFVAPFVNCVSASVEEKCSNSGCRIISESGADLYTLPSAYLPSIYQLVPLEIIPFAMDTLCDSENKNCRWTRVITFEKKVGYLPREKIKFGKDGKIWIVREESGWKIRVIKSIRLPKYEN